MMDADCTFFRLLRRLVSCGIIEIRKREQVIWDQHNKQQDV